MKNIKIKKFSFSISKFFFIWNLAYESWNKQAKFYDDSLSGSGDGYEGLGIYISFLLPEIPSRKFMFFYALGNELLRSGTEFTRFYLVRNWTYPKKRGNSVPGNWVYPLFRVNSVPD